MIFGDKKLFSIECDIVERLKDDSYVHFRFWFDNSPLGDFSDYANLNACVAGLTEFLSYSGKRYEPDLEGKSAEELFTRVYDTIMFIVPPNMRLTDIIGNEEFEHVGRYETPPYLNQRNRFHLDNVGASAFCDSVCAILVETSDGHERVVWLDLKSRMLHSTVLPPGEFERVSDEFLRSVTA